APAPRARSGRGGERRGGGSAAPRGRGPRRGRRGGGGAPPARAGPERRPHSGAPRPRRVSPRSVAGAPRPPPERRALLGVDPRPRSRLAVGRGGGTGASLLRGPPHEAAPRAVRHVRGARLPAAQGRERRPVRTEDGPLLLERALAAGEGEDR